LVGKRKGVIRGPGRSVTPLEELLAWGKFTNAGSQKKKKKGNWRQPVGALVKRGGGGIENGVNKEKRDQKMVEH